MLKLNSLEAVSSIPNNLSTFPLVTCNFPNLQKRLIELAYRPASQSRIPVEHRQVRIRDSEEGTPARGWAYFTYPARLTPLDTPRKVYTNPLAKSCISCEKGWIYRKNRYNDPEAGLCSGKDPSTCSQGRIRGIISSR